MLAYIDATNNGPHKPSRPIDGAQDGEACEGADAGQTGVGGGQTTHERAAQAIRDSVAYDGEDPSEWDLPDGRSVEYHAVLKARSRADELVTTANWQLLGYAGVFGHFDGLEEEEILGDLREHPTPRHGYRHRKAQKEVNGAIRKAKNGNFQTPSRNTLVHRGILPESWATEPMATTGERKPVAAVPFARFDTDHQKPHDGTDGEDYPTTAEARKRLKDRLYTAFRASQTVLVDAPTSLRKSYTVATEPWLRRTDITGDAPVVQLAPTREARDANLAASEKAGVNAGALLGRSELCPVCRGDYDPVPDGEDPEIVLTMNSVPISDWFKQQCDYKGLPFQLVHSFAAENNDQFIDLPCSEGETDCPAHTQWDGVPWADEGDPSHDVIHATHPFAYVPGLRNHCNVVIDETPDFSADITNAQARKAVTAFLRTVNAPVKTYESFIQLAHVSGGGGDAALEQDALEKTLEQEPDREWFVKNPDAHGLAPALAKAIYNAIQYDELDSNNRRSSTVHHEPPRYDEDGDSFGGNWLTVVLDDENTVRTVRHTPNFATARSVVGLDAHPAPHVWQRNIGPMLDTDLSIARVLSTRERRLWRRFERGLTVVQVGDATRPLSGNSARKWFDADSKLDVLLQALRDHAGDDFRTGITTAQVEKPMADRMEGAGVLDPETMHYGEEKSRNDFDNERIGFVNGCMDPGDDYVLDMLAELGLDATVPRADPEDFDDPESAYCDHCEGDGCNRCNQTGRTRERGREFIGPDADVAAALLASVRENHVAQAAGRYARSPDDPENTATVYVRTDAAPEGLVDFTVAGVEWVATDLQREIVRELSRNDAMTMKELAEAVGCSKPHVHNTVTRLEERGLVSRSKGTGAYNADEFETSVGAEQIDAVDLGAQLADPSGTLAERDGDATKPLTDTYYSPSMWSLTVRGPADPDETPSGKSSNGADSGAFGEIWAGDD